MQIWVDLNDPTPIYEQIANATKELVNQKLLRPGDCLPSVRQLAQDLGVNLNTVARAYRELAREGILNVRQGRGASVARARRSYGAAEREALHRSVKRLVNEALSLGLDLEQVRELVASEFQRLKGKEK